MKNLLSLALFAIVFLGCSKAQTKSIAETAPPAFPALPKAQALSEKIDLYDVQLTGDGPGQNMRLWIYLPKGAQKNLPLVVIAPAGSNLLTGMDLGDSDRDEHLPYVNAGFAVVAYSMDGVMPDNPSDATLLRAANAFRASHAGMVNARNAIDYCLVRLPAINPKKIFTAGHSSAGTAAVLLAETDPRIAACAAYAPCIDLEKRLAAALNDLDRASPGFAEFIKESSPSTHMEKLSCPLMLFSAEDDDNISTESVRAAASDFKAKGKKVDLKTVKTGGHYDSMISQGIPAGIAWLKTK